MQESKDYLLVLYFYTFLNTLSFILSELENTRSHYDVGSGWLRWVLKQGHAKTGLLKLQGQRYALGLPFATHLSFFLSLHPSKEPWSVLTSQIEKQVQTAMECR
jgi:hypothetical protein